MRTFMILALAALLVELATGATHTVGGSSGWDTATDLQTWVKSQSFSVGDSLVFQYAPPHTVLEVTKADYDSCQNGNALGVYSGGNTVIPLSSAGKRYFICGVGGHCSLGMKLAVDIVAASTPSTPPVSLPSNSPPPPTTPSTPPVSPPSNSPPTASVPPSTPPKSPDVSPPESKPTKPPHVSPTASPPSTTLVSPAVPPKTTPSGSIPPNGQPSPSSALQVKLTAIGFVMIMSMAFLTI